MNIGTIQSDGSILLHDKNIKFRDAMSGVYRRVRPTTLQAKFLMDNGFQATTSSFITGVGVRDNDLYVRFINASIYVYYGFANYYDDFLAANSQGQYFNRRIRPTKRYKKLDSLPYPRETKASPLELVSDEALFKTLDLDYIRKVANQMVGAEIHIKELLVDGIPFTQYKVNDLVILRPIIESQ